jgi:sugar-specific transcriptional regulator TrmB
MKIEAVLAKIGLTETESTLYLFLLENGISSPPQISKGTQVVRSNAHYVLKQLIEKGLVARQKKGKRYVYGPNDPSAALSLVERKKKILEEAIPDLRALYKQQKNKPVVRFYGGRDEIRAIFEDVLECTSKEVFGFASTGKLFEIIPDYFQKRFQPELKKREIFLKDILTFESGTQVAQATRAAAGAYYEYRVLSQKYAGVLSDVLMWDNTVAIISLEEPIFGTVLVNAQLAHTFRTMFEVMWQSLENGK